MVCLAINLCFLFMSILLFFFRYHFLVDAVASEATVWSNNALGRVASNDASKHANNFNVFYIFLISR